MTTAWTEFSRRFRLRVPDAVQRVSGAPLIRNPFRRGVCGDPGSAAHHFVLRCALDTLVEGKL
jgi:hypothetical protein